MIIAVARFDRRRHVLRADHHPLAVVLSRARTPGGRQGPGVPGTPGARAAVVALPTCERPPARRPGRLSRDLPPSNRRKSVRPDEVLSMSRQSILARGVMALVLASGLAAGACPSRPPMTPRRHRTWPNPSVPWGPRPSTTKVMPPPAMSMGPRRSPTSSSRSPRWRSGPWWSSSACCSSSAGSPGSPSCTRLTPTPRGTPGTRPGRHREGPATRAKGSSPSTAAGSSRPRTRSAA